MQAILTEQQLVAYLTRVLHGGYLEKQERIDALIKQIHVPVNLHYSRGWLHVGTIGNAIRAEDLSKQ